MPERGNIIHPFHSILISALNNSSRHAVYERISNYLSNGQAVIYAVETNPSNVIKKMSKIINQHALSDEDMEIEDYIATGALTVVDRDEFYSSKHTNLLDVDDVLEALRSFALRAKRSAKRERSVLFGSVSVFLQTNNTQKLLQYENGVRHTKSNGVIEAICLYNNPKLFAKLQYSSLLSILTAHDATIHSGWSYRQWYADTIIEYVRQGIDSVLGKGTSNLIFKTLKMVYNLDKEIIISQPEVFENTVTKIIGEKSAGLAFEMIADTIRKEMAFSRTEATK